MYDDNLYVTEEDGRVGMSGGGGGRNSGMIHILLFTTLTFFATRTD